MTKYSQEIRTLACVENQKSSPYEIDFDCKPPLWTKVHHDISQIRQLYPAKSQFSQELLQKREFKKLSHPVQIFSNLQCRNTVTQPNICINVIHIQVKSLVNRKRILDPVVNSCQTFINFTFKRITSSLITVRNPSPGHK